jgi:hypothetical protein
MSFRKRPPSRFADPQMRDFCPVLANDVSVCARQAGPYQALQITAAGRKAILLPDRPRRQSAYRLVDLDPAVRLQRRRRRRALPGGRRHYRRCTGRREREGAAMKVATDLPPDELAALDDWRRLIDALAADGKFEVSRLRQRPEYKDKS